MSTLLPVIYWDASGLISALMRDEHSERAIAYANIATTHLVSSLSWAEAHAVIGRIERDNPADAPWCSAARTAIADAPWRHAYVVPSWDRVQELARLYPLRGADLWHLAAAKTLQADLPELTFVSFDQRLTAAAASEGLVAPSLARATGPR